MAIRLALVSLMLLQLITYFLILSKINKRKFSETMNPMIRIGLVVFIIILLLVIKYLNASDSLITLINAVVLNLIFQIFFIIKELKKKKKLMKGKEQEPDNSINLNKDL